MSDSGKTRGQLTDELATMRQQVARLEASEKEHKRTEAELRQSEKTYKILFESTLDGLIVIDAETLKTVFGNKVAAEMYGFASVEDAVGVDAMGFIHPDDRNRLAAFIAGDVLGKGTGGVTGTRMVRKDGSDFWASASATRIEFGGRPAVLVSIRDVTERRKMEQELRESEKRFKETFQYVGDVIYRINALGEFVLVNDRIYDVLGYRPDELMGHSLFDVGFLDANELSKMTALFTEAVGKGEALMPVIEARAKHKDGHDVLVEVSISRVTGPEGQLEGFMGVVRDVTERKKMEEELLRHRDHLEQLVEERTAELTRTQEIATRQAQEIIEISTPIIQLRKGIILAPLIGSFSSDRAQQFTERLLTAIAQTNSTVALVDITGVPTVDTQTAHYITRTISAVRLLGAQAILTGVGPILASTLVELGIDLSGVVTRSSLAHGFEDAMDLLKTKS
jgi:rsbT co-antagonist protein RsbR